MWTPIACPHCHSYLKTSAGLPAGVEILCPKCKALFKVPAAAPVAGTANSARSSGGISPAKPSNSGKRRIALVGGIIVALGLMIGLLFWAFWGHFQSRNANGKNSSKAAKADDVKEDDVSPIKLDSAKPKLKTTRAPKKVLIHLTDDEEAQLADMKTRALRWFKNAQLADGTWNSFGAQFTGLGGLVLLECGVPPTDETVKRAAANIRDIL